MCEADYTISDFLEESEPVARKQHSCSECGEPILVGQKYILKRWKYDGAINTYRSCQRCYAANKAMDGTVDYCRAYGCLVQDCYDDLLENAPSPYAADSLPEDNGAIINRWMQNAAQPKR